MCIRHMEGWVMTKEFYVLITDGDNVDQIAEGKGNANREKYDLEKMGCQVSMIGPVSGKLAEHLVESFEQGCSVATLRRMVKECGQ